MTKYQDNMVMNLEEEQTSPTIFGLRIDSVDRCDFQVVPLSKRVSVHLLEK